MWRRFKKGAANDSRTGLSIDDTRVAFVHPKSTGGVLVELCQSP